MYTLDTNAIIYYLKDDPKTVNAMRDIFQRDVPLYVSTITEVELFGFSNLTVGESESIETILQTVVILPLDSRIARIAGSLRRLHRLNTADSVIAATALVTGTTLLTRNVRDFRKVTGLPLREI